MGLNLGKPSHIVFGGVDMSSFVADAGFELSPWQESFLDGLPSATLALDLSTGSWGAPMTFEIPWDQLHPETQAYFRRLFAEVRRRRLSRMRAAYRAKGRKRR